MKRPLLVIAMGYIIGIVWGLYCSCNIALLYAILIFIYLLLSFFYRPKKEFKLFSFKRYFRYINIFLKYETIILLIITSFISNLTIINQNKNYNMLYKDISDANLTGIIVSNDKTKGNAVVYKIKVEQLNESSKFKNTYLLLRVNASQKEKIKYGDRVKVKGTFLKPSTKRNYKGFDYKEFLKTQKIYGTVKASNLKVISNNCVNYAFTISNKVFLKIKNNIKKIMPEKMSNILLGIMLGYTDDLEDSIREEFTDSSMAHILAVSGMHITYITIAVMKIVKPSLGKRNGKIITSIFLITYMFITGFSPSAVRATLMQITYLLSGVFFRKNDIWNSLSISILIILIYNPFLITSVSVLLSYGGVIGIITLNKTVLNLLKKIKIKNKKYKYKINKKFAKAIKFIRESFSMSISVQLIIIPIISTYFNTFSLSFIITNFFLSLIIKFLIALGLLLISSAIISYNLAKIISIFYAPFINFLLFICKIGSIIPLSKIYIRTPNIYEISIYYIFIYTQNFIFKIYLKNNTSAFEYRIRNIISLIRYTVKINKKRVISAIILVIIIFLCIRIIPQKLKIYFIDVGQGDSTLIVTPQKHSILIDGGGNENTDFDVGKSTLIPYLLARQITKIDYIFISHFDYDHVGRYLYSNGKD